MKTGYTDITVLLDRSGSMEAIRSDIEGGFKTFVEEQKKLKVGECKLTLIQFDSDAHEVVYTATLIQDVPTMVLVPRGCTPLLDSTGKAIVQTGERFSLLPEEQRPELVLFVIITDGLENASHEYKLDRIKEMIQHQTDVYKWKFTYLGANQDAFQEATQMGIPVAGALTYTASPVGVQNMFKSVAQATNNLRTGDAVAYCYSPSDHQAQNESYTPPDASGGPTKIKKHKRAVH